MNRTRSQGALFPKTTPFYVTDATCTSGVQLLSYINVAKLGQFKSMSDSVTPNFFEKRRKGEIVMTPMSSLEVWSSGSSAGHKIKGAQTCTSPVKYRIVEFSSDSFLVALTGATNSTIPCPGVIPESDMERMRDLVSTRTWAGRGKSTNANLFETFAELHKVSSLWKNLNGRILNVIRKPVKSLADEHLMFKFGLKPLLSDLQFVLDRSLDVLKKEQTRYTTRSTDKIEASKTSTLTANLVDHGVITYSLAQTDSFVIRGTCIDDFSGSVLDTWGLSPKSLITLPWELTGYSFVADYFVNIGDFLNAITPAFGYDYRGSCLTETRTTSCKYTFLSYAPLAGYTTLTNPSGSAESKSISKIRTALRTPSIVRQYQPMFSGDTFNFSRAVTLAELVTQAALRKAR